MAMNEPFEFELKCVQPWRHYAHAAWEPSSLAPEIAAQHIEMNLSPTSFEDEHLSALRTGLARFTDALCAPGEVPVWWAQGPLLGGNLPELIAAVFEEADVFRSYLPAVASHRTAQKGYLETWLSFQATPEPLGRLVAERASWSVEMKHVLAILPEAEVQSAMEKHPIHQGLAWFLKTSLCTGWMLPDHEFFHLTLRRDNATRVTDALRLAFRLVTTPPSLDG